MEENSLDHLWKYMAIFKFTCPLCWIYTCVLLHGSASKIRLQQFLGSSNAVEGQSKMHSVLAGGDMCLTHVGISRPLPRPGSWKAEVAAKIVSHRIFEVHQPEGTIDIKSKENGVYSKCWAYAAAIVITWVTFQSFVEIKTIYQAKQKFERIEQDWTDKLLYKDEAEDPAESYPNGTSPHEYDDYAVDDYDYEDYDVFGKSLKSDAQLDLSTIKSILNDFSSLHSTAQVIMG